MPRFKPTILTVALALVWLPLAAPAVAANSSAQTACDSFYNLFQTTVRTDNGTAPVKVGEGVPKLCTPEQAIGNVIQLLLEFSAMVAVVFLMIGGFWYLTAAGSEEQSEKGRKTLTSAIIGLVVIIMAYAIVRITVNLVTNGLAGGSVSGGNASSNSNNSSGGNQAGNGGNGNSNTAGNGTSATGNSSGNTGTPFSTNPNNILSNLTQEDYAAYDNSADHLSARIVFSNSAQGLTAVSTVLTSDKQSLGQLAAACGAATPPDVQLYLNGTYNTGATYQNQGSGTWTATLNYSGPLNAGDNFQIYVCGKETPAHYTPPR